MLNKQPININFSQGLDTKTDPWQVTPGKFLSLQNTIFTKAGMLQKRNGFGQLTSLPNANSSYLTTLNGSLTALGSSVYAYSTSANSWVSKGSIQNIGVSTMPVIRNSSNQSQADIAVALNGLACVAYTQGSQYFYAVIDSSTGQNIVSPTLIPASVSGSPRVFAVGSYFAIVFTASSNLQYIAISTVQPAPSATVGTIAAGYSPSTGLSWDGVSAANNLYICYPAASTIKATYLTQTLLALGGSGVTATTIDASRGCTLMSVCADNYNSASPTIYACYFNGSTIYASGCDVNLAILSGFPATMVTGVSVDNLTCVASNGLTSLYYEIANSGIPEIYTVTKTRAGSASVASAVVNTVGLASKAFMYNSQNYLLLAYSSSYQPTYFLVNASLSTSAAPMVIAKLAYSNGGGLVMAGLPFVSIDSLSNARVAYLYKDLIASVNKNTGATGQVGQVYAQTGINMATFDLDNTSASSVELASSLQLSGGFLWMYDGYLPVENNFFLFPDGVSASITSTSSGNITAGTYYYQVTYEWSDNQGNIHRSAPSIPIGPFTTTTANNTISIVVPYLGLTYKTANPPSIVVYRYSTNNPIYYAIKPASSSPTLNDPTSGTVTISDTASDSSIIGNTILYTTGGVVENTNGPASNIMAAYDTRLWLVDAEDTNLLWYSKQVIENTPVEMSDLFTIYISPTIGASGSTGPITAIVPLDDKLIIFKSDAIYYINGSGPDNAGANSQYSEPIFITSTVGCNNIQSICFIPEGLMFQSDKGIWLLGRNMQTSYIGAPVEKYNSQSVISAVDVPSQNQARFILSSGITLMYDYFYGNWGTFTNTPAIASCIYNGLHTYLNSSGQVYQETPGVYLDGANQIQISFTTSWLNLAGVQGYERIYDFYLIGSFISPHNLIVSVAYDYGAPSQQVIITPNNYTGVWGSDPVWDVTNPWGGNGNLEQWRVHTSKQTCQSFQISVTEQFNSAFNTIPGAGLTLSGITCRVGLKKGTRPIAAASSIG